jgi:hypothetical protein
LSDSFLMRSGGLCRSCCCLAVPLEVSMVSLAASVLMRLAGGEVGTVVSVVMASVWKEIGLDVAIECVGGDGGAFG